MHPRGGVRPIVRRSRIKLRFRVDRRAVAALEYATIAGLLAVVVLTAASTLATGLSNIFNYIAAKL